MPHYPISSSYISFLLLIIALLFYVNCLISHPRNMNGTNLHVSDVLEFKKKIILIFTLVYVMQIK